MIALENTQLFFVVVLALFVPIASFISYHFVQQQGNQPIRARYPTLVLVQTAVVSMYVALLCVSRIVYSEWPCWMSLWLGHIGLVVIANSYLVRCWILLVSDSITAYTVEHKASSAPLSSTDVPISLRYPILRSLPFMLKVLTITSLVMFIPAAIAHIYYPNVRSNTGPQCNRGFADLVLVIYGLIYLLIFAMFGYLLRNVIDGLYLKRELRTLAIVSLIALIPWYLFSSQPSLADYNNTVFPITSLILITLLLACFALTTIMPLYYAVFLPPPPSVSVEQLRTLPSLLETKEGYDAFHEFVKLEFALENLYFWKAVREYRSFFATLQQSDSMSDSQKYYALFEKASTLYSEFLTSGKSYYEVNVSGKVSSACTQNLQLARKLFEQLDGSSQTPSQSVGTTSDSASLISTAHNDDFSVNPFSTVQSGLPALSHIFDAPFDAVFALMETDSFKRFSRSEIWEKLNAQSERTQVLLSGGISVNSEDASAVELTMH